MAGVSAGQQYYLTRDFEPGHSLEGKPKKEQGWRAGDKLQGFTATQASMVEDNSVTELSRRDTDWRETQQGGPACTLLPITHRVQWEWRPT